MRNYRITIGSIILAMKSKKFQIKKHVFYLNLAKTN